MSLPVELFSQASSSSSKYPHGVNEKSGLNMHPWLTKALETARRNTAQTPQGMLDHISYEKKREYDQTYRPINKEMIESVNSTDMVDAARETANQGFDAAKERQQRMAQRYGINYSAIEADELARRAAGKRSLNYDDTVNRSRFAQYERNNQVAQEMIAVGRGIDTSATQQMIQSANLQTQRQNNNRMIDAQNRASSDAMMGNIASAGLMAAAFLIPW